MILLIDNYDSFTYNLAHLFQELGAEVAVVRNDRIVVPRGDTLIRVGDEVLVLVTTDSEEEVRQILTGA